MTGDNKKDWWQHYHDGKIIRRDGTPMSIIRTLENWCNACLLPENDPMWQFVKNNPVNPRKLQAAVRECIQSNTLGMKEQKKLLDLEVWVIREAALAAAAKNLREAERELYQAAKHAGLDNYHTYKIATVP